MAHRRLPTIRASEVGEYVYCARSWWLRRVAGLEPEGRERRERGVTLHRRHARSVALSRLLLAAAVLLGVAALIVLVGGGYTG
jgi:CRISPR/Cas system-associated exonuclease Cas4 (RecB family)